MTHDRVFLIYALMSDVVDMNLGVIIFLKMRKVCFYRGASIALVVF